MTEEFQSNACLLSMLSENLKLQLFTRHFSSRLVRSARKDDKYGAEHDYCQLSGMEECMSFLSTEHLICISGIVFTTPAHFWLA